MARRKRPKSFCFLIIDITAQYCLLHLPFCITMQKNSFSHVAGRFSKHVVPSSYPKIPHRKSGKFFGGRGDCIRNRQGNPDFHPSLRGK